MDGDLGGGPPADRGHRPRPGAALDRRPGRVPRLTAIAARGVGFTYDGASAAALQDIDLEVPAGACLLVIGPSGSGKSTLALALAGLVPREIPGTWTGELTIGGDDTRALPPGVLAARVGMVFQDPSRQLVMDRVEDDVAFGLENLAWPRSAMIDRVPVALGSVGLDAAARRLIHTLSGGERQRLALAGALAPEPAILVLDEPTANLDPASARAFLAELARWRASEPRTIVLIEHRVDAAWPLADLVLALDRTGRPLASGRPEDVLSARDALAAEGIWLPGDPSPTDPPPTRLVVASDHPGGPVVAARDLAFAYEPGRSVLHGIDLDVERGDRIALVGPNGSGKSTLARLLVGLLRPSNGTVRLAARDPVRMPAADLSRAASYVFQEPESQFLARTVRDEVDLGLRDDERPRVEPLMVSLGLPLDTFGERSPYRLSGGEQRRLSLATALVRRPRVLVLDEPTFGQDRHGYDGLLAILEEHLAAGASLVAATHDERFVADVATRVVRLDAGTLIDDAAVR